MKKTLFLFTVLNVSTVLAAGDGISFNGSFRQTLYAYQSDRRHTRLMQFLNFNAAPASTLSVSGNLRAISDLSSPNSVGQRLQLYALHVDYHAFGNRLETGAGRLFLHAGTTLGSLDGVQMRLETSRRTRWMLYGGVQSPFDRRFEFDAGGGTVFGSTFDATLRKSSWQLFFLQRLRDGAVVRRETGVNASLQAPMNTAVKLQSRYNLEDQRLQHFLVSARSRWGRHLRFNMEYRRRRPQVEGDAFLAVFTPRPYQLWRATAEWEWSEQYALELQTQQVFFERGRADHISLGINTPFGSASAVWESGYAGDHLGVMLNAFVEPFCGLLLSAYVDYSRYRTEQIYQFEQQSANAVRLSYRFSRHFSADVEAQWLNDRLRRSDARLLNHFTYKW